MKKKITFLIAAAFMLLTMMASTATAWGQTRGEEVYSTCLFGGTHGTSGNYTSTWTATNGDFSWSVANGNTNNSNWNYVKFGRKNVESVGTVTTASAYIEAITKVDVTIDAITTNSVNSIKLYTSSDGSTWTAAGTYTKSTGTKSVSLSNPTANLYYKVEFDCASGSANGLVSVSKIEYYHSTGGNPTCATPIFNPEAGTYTSAQNVTISTTTGDATIYYTIDGSDPTTSSSVYSTAIPVSTTTTIKAMATASGYDNSSIASATYTIVNIEHAGTAEDPYTVADARAAIDANTGMTGVYATGIVSQIVTPYDSGYSNITFNIVDEAGDEVFLQAYRCGGTDAANVQVGYTAVVTGNLTKYGNTYEFAQGCTLVSLTPPATPYITANDVEIPYDATFGEIGFTINNSVAGGYLEPTTEVTWLSFGNVEGNIANFVCDANNGTQRVAPVVLIYHYGSESVSKNITVTQAGNPDVVDHIEDITEAGEYTIQGTIVAKSTRGFVLGDGTGYIYYYKGSEPTQSVGDIVRIVGEVSAPTNYKVFQYTSSATITTATSSEYVPIEPVPTSGADMDGTVTGTGVYQTDYVQYAGTLTVNDTHYNITSIDGATTAIGSISYPTNTDFTSLDGKQVTVTGYYVGVSSNKYFNTMLGSIEEVVGEPSITLPAYSFDVNADGGDNEIPVTYTNMPADPQAEVIFYESNGETVTTYGWITATINTNGNIDGHIDVNDGAARTAYFKVKGIDANNNDVYSNLVTINQAVASGPSIVFNNASLDIVAGGENRTMSFDYTGLGTNPEFSVNFYSATGEPTTYDWITAVITAEEKVNLTIEANTGAARTAYFKVYGVNGSVNAESNVVTINQAAGSVTPTGDKYVKVTSSSDFTDGQYLIVYEEGGLAFDGSLETLDASGNTISVNISNNEIPVTSTTAASEFTIAAITGGYSIQSASGYYIGQTSDANGLASSTETVYTNDISFDEGNANIVSSSAYLRYNNASNQARFRYYKSASYTGQKAIQLYKKATGPATPSITANDVVLAYNVTAGVIEYTINNPVAGGNLQAIPQTGGDLLTFGEIGENTISFAFNEANNTSTDKTVTVKLQYTYGSEEAYTIITLTQAANPALLPSITVDPDLVEVEAAGGDGELTVTYQNVDPDLFDIQWTDAEGNPDEEPNWIDLEINSDHNVYYLIDENTEANARVAYFVVYGLDNATDYVYSNVVTISQAGAVTPGTTGTITFGNAEGSTNINSANVTGTDSMGNTWTITTEGTSSFTPNAAYAQVGSSSKPASSITFTTTLPSSATITAFEAKFGGFSGTAGDITLKVDDTTVGQGSLNATEDVIVTNSSTATGTTLTVTVTNIAKGVKCYYISYTISTGSDPIIVAQNTINLSSTDTYGEFDYEVINAVPGTSLNATSTDSWISNINVTGEKVTFSTTQNTSTTDDREGTITLSYEGATNKTVSVIQSKVDYAALPFDFDGGKNNIESTTGLTQEGLGNDYSSTANLRFDDTGDYLILHLNAAPASLSYDIKGNSFSGGTYKVQTSADGVNYSDLATYTELAAVVQSVTLIDLDVNVRYIKWIYTEKATGNVGMGNIHASANYDIYGTLNIDSFDATMHPTIVHEKGIIYSPGMVMSSQPDDILIEDGGQVITNVEFMATLQKNISGYGDDPTVANGWYLISSPVANLSTSAVTIDTYDLFAYEEAAAYWWSNTGSNSFDALQQGIGYLYANSANQTLNFAGTMVGTNTAVEKAMTAECTYDNLKGYNLMGNPFTCNLENGDIKIGATAITSVLVAEGGDDYVTVNLNDDGAVKPGQGFMVQTAASATLTLNPGSSKGANSGFVRIVAGNENATDKAYINVANGNTLRKISLSDNTTQVYVMNDDKDYAAARVEELAGTMPVHFKAAEDGEYTITIEAVNADVEYMHLIDNFTGNDVDLLLESNYTFNATTNDSEARFRLDFGTYGVNEIAENNTFAYQYGNEIVVNGEGELQIFDLMGRMIMNTTINGVQSVNVPSNSVYILKLNNNIQKIVVK